MARQAEAAESSAALCLDERLAADAAEIKSVVAKAGDARKAVGVLLVQLG